MKLIKKNLLLTCLIIANYSLFGCGQSAAPPEKVAQSEPQPHGDHSHDRSEQGHSPDKAGHSHDGWWCDEHGIPEAECAQCDAKVAAAFQKKGDWCKEHDRPDSQCFICHPEKADEFAAKYEAKFGKKPPKPVLN